MDPGNRGEGRWFNVKGAHHHWGVHGQLGQVHRQQGPEQLPAQKGEFWQILKRFDVDSASGSLILEQSSD